MKHTKTLFTAIILLILSTLSHNSTAKDKVLILNSYGFDYQWSNSIIDSISLGIKSKLPDVEFDVEYISTERFSNPQIWVDRINLSIKNYANDKPSAIVIVSDEAWMAYRAADTEIFKGIPLFLCAIKPHSIDFKEYNQDLHRLTLEDFELTTDVMKKYGATGVIREMNVPMYIGLMDDLIPKLDSYTIITDQRFYGTYSRLLIEEYLKNHHSSHPVRYIDGRHVTTDSLLKILPDVSTNSGVLLTSWITGENGFEYSKMYIYQEMEKILNTPIFITNDIGLNTGCFIGGYFSDSKFWGSKVSKMVVKSLKGTPLDSIKPQTTKDEQCWINWDIATRYNIQENKLPQHTSYINRPTPIYIEYSNELLTAGFVLIVLLSSLTYAIKANLSLQRAQKSTMQAIAETDQANKHLITTQRELKKALYKAKAADRLKSAFISNMDHEIRTPLNSIVGFANILSIMTDKEDIDEAIKQINENSDKLLSLIKGIIDLSQMEAEGSVIDINYEVVNLDGLLQDLVNYNNTMVRPDVVIRFTPPEQPFSITTDRHLLTKALSCIMDNAVKFTMKGTIDIGYQATKKGMVKFYVKDTGIGIENSEIKHIFERFYKCNSHIAGSGLGLSIAKKIIELLGGTLEIESTPEVGTTFWFQLKTN